MICYKRLLLRVRITKKMGKIGSYPAERNQPGYKVKYHKHDVFIQQLFCFFDTKRISIDFFHAKFDPINYHYIKQ